MYFARRPLISLLLIGIFLASCGGQPAASEPTPDVNATIASGAQTMVASVFQTQTAAAPTVTNTASPTVTAASTTSPMALPSPLATFTQGFVFFATATPTGTFYTPTPNPNTLSYGCNNLLLIESFTEPEGPFQPGQSFEQNWQVANTGTCDWLYLYELVYVSGERMSGNSRRLSKKIEPGKWTTLSVELEAPAGAGTHSASWRFTDGAGHGFGSTLPVSITVKTPTRTPQPTTYP
ncbi:MAG TPA: NBR1-Ig-like domain-containing protein [Anaerolineales bacterium]|nr:NBR1-Ig-like domain-containing protein [Anaerolineales bacterium]